MASANFWKERQKSLSTTRSSLTLAALPPLASSSLGSGFIEHASAISNSGFNIARPNALNDKRISGSEILNLIRSISALNSTVQGINIPRTWTNGQPVVLIMQDVHLNSEAQAHIAQSLSDLVSKNRIDFIGLEGGFGPINFGGFRDFTSQQSVRAAASYLKNKNQLSGPMFTALTSDKNWPPLIGIDEKSHYLKNVDAYQRSQQLSTQAQAFVAQTSEDLDKQKQVNFSKDLLAFDRVVTDYRDGKTSWTQYLDSLVANRDDTPAPLSQFLKLAHLEKEINFDKAEQERTKVLERLLEDRPFNKVITDQAIALKEGRKTRADFYGFIRQSCTAHKIPVQAYPAFASYLDYAMAADQLDVQSVIRSADTLVNKRYEELIKNETDKKLVNQSDKIYLTHQMTGFSLTALEWNKYKELAAVGVDAPDWISTYEDFYREAERRDQAITRNVISSLHELNGSVAALVVGGFHSGGVERKLAEKNIATITIAPRLTKVESDKRASYLSIFAQERTPLEQLFNKEKLFLSPPIWTPAKKVFLGALTLAQYVWLQSGKVATATLRQYFEQLTGEKFKSFDFSWSRDNVSIFVDGTKVGATISAQGEILDSTQQKTSWAPFLELWDTLKIVTGSSPIPFLQNKHENSSDKATAIQYLIGLRVLSLATWTGGIIPIVMLLAQTWWGAFPSLSVLMLLPALPIGFNLVAHYFQRWFFPFAQLTIDEPMEEVDLPTTINNVLSFRTWAAEHQGVLLRITIIEFARRINIYQSTAAELLQKYKIFTPNTFVREQNRLRNKPGPSIPFDQLTGLETSEVGISRYSLQNHGNPFKESPKIAVPSISKLLPNPEKAVTSTISLGEGENEVTFTLRKAGTRRRIWSFVRSRSYAVGKLANLTPLKDDQVRKLGIPLNELKEIQPDEIGITAPWFVKNPHPFPRQPTIVAAAINRLLPDPPYFDQPYIEIGEGDDRTEFILRKSGHTRCWCFLATRARAVANLASLPLRDDFRRNDRVRIQGFIDEAFESLRAALSDPRLFGEMAIRYGVDIRNILWALVGSRLAGGYDKELLSRLIDEKLLEALEDLSAADKEDDEYIDVGGKNTIETPPDDDTGRPRIRRRGLIEQDDIDRVARHLDRRMAQLHRDQALEEEAYRSSVRFLFRLEETRVFQRVFAEKPGPNTIEAAKQEIRRRLSENPPEILRIALDQLQNEIVEAAVLQQELHEKGLKKNRYLNLYQLIGVSRMRETRRIILGDEMGLGKTLETLATFLVVDDAAEMLILGPKMALTRWQEEIRDFFDVPMEPVVLTSGVSIGLPGSREITKTKDRLEYLYSERLAPSSGKRVILMNYELLPGLQSYQEAHSGLPPINIDFLALDEAHLAKNIKTKRSLAIWGNGQQLPIQSRYQVFATGTPLENRVKDLFAYLKAMANAAHAENLLKDPQPEPTAEDLVNDFFATTDFRRLGRIFSAKNLPRMSQLHMYLLGRMVRRLKRDVIRGLPPVEDVSVKLDMSDGTMDWPGHGKIQLPGNYGTQRDLYNMALHSPEDFEELFSGKPLPDEAEEEEEAIGKKGKEVTQIIRLEQTSLNPGLFGVEADSIKFDAAKHIIDDAVHAGQSVLVFSFYRTITGSFRDFLLRDKTYQGGRVSYIDGNVNPRERTDELEAFQNEQSPVMVATTGTMRLALQATQASVIIFLDSPWKPSDRNQAIARVDRFDRDGRHYPGKTIKVYNLQADHPELSIDIAKHRVLERKRDVG